MRLLHTKSEPDRVLDSVGDSFAALGSGVNRSKLLKAGLIAGGLAALTAGARPSPRSGAARRGAAHETASCRSGCQNFASGRHERGD